MNNCVSWFGVISFCAMPFFPQVLPAQEMTGEAIIQKVNDLMNPSSTQAKIEMIVHGKGDKKRTFVYNSWSMDEGEKNLVRYIQPRRLKGQATLMLNHADDIWMYFARTKRVRKLASHAKKQKMEGSDFSYEDMGSGDSFLTDYQARRLDDDRINDLDCYQVALLKKQGSDVGYSKIILWVVQENFVPIRMDYYDEDQPERVYKRLIQSDIRMIDDIPTAMHMIMENLNDGTSTEITFREINYNMDLSASMFTERGLRQ